MIEKMIYLRKRVGEGINIIIISIIFNGYC